MLRIVAAAFTAMLMVGCTSEKEEVPEPSVDPSSLEQENSFDNVDSVNNIAWFDGTVEEAFAVAKEFDKPVFLYWGAEWCPPCHAIKATVFNRPEFIERSKLFVPVYLDGDQQNAQAYGEKFGVLGYPTMIVFDSEGGEVTRIPGGIDLQAYANILDLTLSSSSSAADVVKSVMDGADISESDCTLLAYNSWGQNAEILAEYDEAEAFRRMHAACPHSMLLERSILYFSWLDKVIEQAQTQAEAVPLSEAERAEAIAQIKGLLADQALANANIFTVLFSGADFVSELTDQGSEERAELVSDFYSAYDRLAADESIYKRERIYTLFGKISFERIDNEGAEISESLKTEIRDMTEWADESTPSVYERQPIINALANVLLEAGMDDQAKPLLLAEVERSQQPYYYMPDLADIEQRAGNEQAALDWLETGYDATRGPATRFQWGYYYLTGLLEMSPTEVELIHRTTVRMLAELQQSNAFHHRPKSQLRRLESYLLEWGETEDNLDALSAIRDSVLSLCEEIPESDNAREVCEEFLDPT